MLDACCYTEEYCFVIDSVQIRNFSMDEYNYLDSLKEIEANNYAIALNAQTLDAICWAKMSFGGNLLAYSCEEEYYRLKSKVVNISIKSNQNLNSNYPAGSELKALFRPIDTTRECLSNNPNHDKTGCLNDLFKLGKSDSLEYSFNEFMALNNYFNNFYAGTATYNSINLFSLHIDENVEVNKHKIAMKFEFEDGQILEAVTDEVIIK